MLPDVEVKEMADTVELTPKQAAQRLGICLDSVYSLLWAGKLEGQRRDGRWYISTAAVEQRLAQRRGYGDAATADPERR